MAPEVQDQEKRGRSKKKKKSKSKSKSKKRPSPKRVSLLNQEPAPMMHEVEIDPDEEILKEGEMFKFKPGIEKNFISRWI